MTLNLQYSSFHLESAPLSAEKLDKVRNWAGEDQLKYHPNRLQEWLGGRYCAKQAFSKIGFDIHALPAGENRAPIWPENTIGSISHTKGLVVAVASKEAKGLGVDCENMIPPERFESLKSSIARLDEAKILDSRPDTAPTLMFSAKEALYKNIHPRCGVFFGFLEARILDFDQNKFWLELISEQEALQPFNGIYNGGYLLQENKVISWIESV